ncbi:unnamed protein product [marine sediment metagenome]|uniref:ABC transporter domain-containing protein n=2 Tax=marine sediment metagenome TaxID=412755 RepID=X1BPS4_9ZZZZ
MKSATIVIPSYWGPAGGLSGGEDEIIFDHPTPLNEEGTLGRLLDSFELVNTQDFNLFSHLSALDNVRIGLIKVKKMEKGEATEEAMRHLARVGLEDKAAAYPAELSGGQQQRVSIARALAMGPKLMLFDEPTSALDPELIGEVLEVMRDLAESGMTMVVVSHEMGFARSVCNEIVFIENGVIVEQGPPEVMFENPEHQRTKEFLCKISELYGKSERK